jgi:Glycosyltransferase family 87
MRFPPRLGLCLALIGAASMLYYHQRLFIPSVVVARTAQGLRNDFSFGNDFYQVWLTSRELLQHRSDPYSPEITREIQIGLYGHPLDPPRPGDPVDRRIFPYPAFADLLFWPSAEFPFAPMRVAVVCVLALLTLASVPLWTRALEWRLSPISLAVILLFTLCSYPALEALYAAQLGLLVAFLLAAAMVALQQHRFLLAGIFMAITTIKPQVTVLAVVYLLLWSLYDWRVRGRFCLGFFSTLALLVGTSLAVLPHWIQSWIHTILAYRHYNPPPLVAQVLTSPLGPRLAGPATFVLTAASIVIAIALAWHHRAAAYGSFAFWITLTLLLSITTIIVLPGQAIYDHLILLPGILLLVRYRSELREAGPVPRALQSAGLLVLLWPWIAAFAVILLHAGLAPATFNSMAILSLPIRTAASLPFVVLALLAWTLRINSARNQATA